MTQISEFSLAFYLVTSFYSIRLVNCRKRLITGSKVHAWTHVVYFPLWDVFDNSLIIYSCFVRSPLANTTDVIAHAYVRATLMDVEVIETQFLNFSSPNFLVVAVQRDIPGTYLELRSRSNGPILWAMNPGTAYWTRFDREHSIVGWIQKGFWVDLCPSIPGSGGKGGGGGGGVKSHIWAGTLPPENIMSTPSLAQDPCCVQCFLRRCWTVLGSFGHPSLKSFHTFGRQCWMMLVDRTDMFDLFDKTLLSVDITGLDRKSKFYLTLWAIHIYFPEVILN